MDSREEIEVFYEKLCRALSPIDEGRWFQGGLLTCFECCAVFQVDPKDLIGTCPKCGLLYVKVSEDNIDEQER